MHSTVDNAAAWPCSLPDELQALDIAPKIRTDPKAIVAASTDFGGLSKSHPSAVLYPDSEYDIARLVRFAFESDTRLTVAARGTGHSVNGQPLATEDGVVVHMRNLARSKYRRRISVSSGDALPAPYADVGGEQLWSEVLDETLKHGLSPCIFTDYLDLTVGGTLSVGGIGGQAFRYGPQVSNVYELDVITGKGEMLTCSESLNSDLFYAALGGLGQFGIITRARIALIPAPTKARWTALIYTDFHEFTKDMEHLISMEETPGQKKGCDYLEGFFLNRTQIKTWRSPFLSREDAEKAAALVSQHGGIYLLETVFYYDDNSASTIDQAVKSLMEGLSFYPGFMFTRDLRYPDFLYRVRLEEQALRSVGLWDICHPWFHLLVPKSAMHDINEKIFRDMLEKTNPMGIILAFPLNRNKWDERMSVMFPDDEEVFYQIGLLFSATTDTLQRVLHLIEEIIRFCRQNGIEPMQYPPDLTTREDWMNHFGPKWNKFMQLKVKYDPKAILAPGQKIFTSPLI